MIEPSWLSVIPIILTILVAFKTKEVIVALFTGLISGGIVAFILTGDVNKLNIIEEFMLPNIASGNFAKIIIVYLICLGGIIGIWSRAGTAAYFGKSIGKKIVKGPKSAMFFTWFLGLLFHQGGNISAILTSTISKNITDRHKISHEELAYVVDSTASNAVTLIPLNIYPIYVAAVLVGTTSWFTTTMEATKFYFSSIFFNFYSITAISITLLFSLELLPWVGSSMSKAKNRARKYGLLDAEDAETVFRKRKRKMVYGFKPSVYEFFIPILVLLLGSALPFVIWWLELIPSNSKISWTTEAFMLSLLSTILTVWLRGMPVNKIIQGFVAGCKDLTVMVVILALATSVGQMAKTINIAGFIIDVVGNNIPVLFYPVILMFTCMIIAFATGTSLGTYAVMFPISMPLAFELQPELLYIQICFGAIMGGAVFGDQCSHISDTTIFSSMLSGCDLMDHVKTQLPLALLSAFISALLLFCLTGIYYS